jgi:hypothetical protein
MSHTAPVDWLLEPENPSARYLALTALLGRRHDAPEVIVAQNAIPNWGPAKAMLDAQWPAGYWMRPGTGYSPRHKATVWQVIFLAALGTPCTDALHRACTYVLDHSRLPDGRFSAYKTAKGAITCLNGNLVRAMLQLGYRDPRLEESLEALAEMAARDEFRCRFNAIGVDKKSPAARMRDGLACAWGAIKALGAFAEVPPEQRSRTVQAAVEAGVEFLLGGDDPAAPTTRLASGDYATATEPNPLWLKFGFPLGYTSDLLEAMEVLLRLGLGDDPRLSAAAKIVHSKRDKTGRWALEHKAHNTWGKFGQVGQPNKWVTVRALGVLTNWDQQSRKEMKE